MTAKQLVLPIQAAQQKTFDNFVVGENQLTVQTLQSVAYRLSDGAQFKYLYGPTGTGKTHLMMASCREVELQGNTQCYIDLQTAIEFPTQALDQVSRSGVFALDHIEVVSGDLITQKCLLSAIERIRNNGGVGWLAGDVPVASLEIELPDLLSRIKSFPAHQLIELDDAQKQQALSLMAQAKGFALSADVARWMLVHESRELHQLSALLDRVDALSLEQKRTVTIPLIKMLTQV